LSVVGPSGERIDVGALVADATNPLLLSAALTKPLAPGHYTVVWHAVAKDDGHPSQGQFDFTVDPASSPSSASAGAAAAALASPPPTQPSTSADTAANATLQWSGVEAPGYVIARWFTLASLLTVLGVVSLALLVLPRVAAHNDAMPLSTFKTDVRRRAASLGVGAALVLILASVWRLYAELSVVGGTVTIATLLHSYWGHVWLTQVVLAAILVLTFAFARREQPLKKVSGGWPLTVIAVVVISGTPAFSGHAAAATDNRVLSIVLDVLHVLAAGGWLGGLVVLAVAGVPAAIAARSKGDVGDSVPLIARLVNAFSPLALVLASVVVLTGAVAAWLHLGSFSALFHSSYGTVLLIKLACVILVLLAGAFNWLRMRGALAHHETLGSAIAGFRRSAWSELTAGVLVIAATAVLIALQPPIH
jgi:copper transport protein